jgi:hypothetical protein
MPALRLAAAAAVLAAASASVSLKLRKLDLNTYPFAVCNDGSPAGYYIRPSTTGSTTTLIFQEGGGW